MKKLSIRKRGEGAYEVGPVGVGPSIMVNANDKRDALSRGKVALKTAGTLDAVRLLPTRYERSA